MPEPSHSLDATEISPAVWRRSGRPLRGQIIRAYVVTTAVAGAFVFLGPPASWIVAGCALGLALLIPRAFEFYLHSWERRVHDVDRRQADRLQQQLRGNRWIRSLAPHGWLALQEGLLQLRRQDGRGAAKCFAEAERLAKGAPGTSSLVSAQAHALVLAGDRRPARELLHKLQDARAMSARDHLDLGLVLLQEAGRNRDARTHVEEAHAQLGDHPRVLAALSLAEQRAGLEDTSYAHFVAAAAALADSEDELGQELLKRARKGLRERIKREQKRARVEEERAVESVVQPSTPPVRGEPRKTRRAERNKRKRRQPKQEESRSKEVRAAPERKPQVGVRVPMGPSVGAAANPKVGATSLFDPPSLARPPGATRPAPLLPPAPLIPPPPKVGGPSAHGSARPRPPAQKLDDGWDDALTESPSAPSRPAKRE